MITFLTWWAGGALFTLVWLATTTMILIRHHGAAWWADIRKRMGETGDSSLVKTSLFFLFLWPMIMFHWTKAAFMGISIFELILLEAKEAKEKRDQTLKAARVDLIRTLTESEIQLRSLLQQLDEIEITPAQMAALKDPSIVGRVLAGRRVNADLRARLLDRIDKAQSSREFLEKASLEDVFNYIMGRPVEGSDNG